MQGFQSTAGLPGYSVTGTGFFVSSFSPAPAMSCSVSLVFMQPAEGVYVKYPQLTVKSCRHALRLFVIISILTACTEQNLAVPAAKAASNDTSPAEPTAFSATSSAIRKAAAVAANTSSARTAPPKIKYNAGENPEFAKQCGWPVNCPAPLPGSILPNKRIVAYYGNPLSKKMGALGEFPKEDMLQKLKERWKSTRLNSSH